MSGVGPELRRHLTFTFTPELLARRSGSSGEAAAVGKGSGTTGSRADRLRVCEATEQRLSA